MGVLATNDIPSQKVIADVMDDVKFDKQNAAFKACQMLYEIGQLNENLKPK